MTRTEEILKEISSEDPFSGKEFNGEMYYPMLIFPEKLATYLASLEERVKELERGKEKIQSNPYDARAGMCSIPKEPVSWEEELKCLGAAYTLACTKNYDRDMQELESFIAEEKAKSYQEGLDANQPAIATLERALFGKKHKS